MKKIFSILLALFLFCTPVFASDLYPALGALTGGGTGALDKIDGAGLSDGDAAIVILSTGSYPYHLNATSGAAENSPYIIAPDTNAGTKRWILVIPKGPFGHVRARTSAGQSIPNATWTTVIFGTEDYDDLNEHNVSTGIFTAAYAGKYSISANNHFSSGVGWTATDNLYYKIVKNSTDIKLNFTRPVTATTRLGALPLADTIDLAVSDTIKIQIYQDTGGAITLDTNDDYNVLVIDRLP